MRRAKKRCVQCGGLVARPGLFGCSKGHPKPDPPERIARAIEEDIRDRRGLKGAFESIDDDTQDEIRDAWVEIIADIFWSEFSD